MDLLEDRRPIYRRLRDHLAADIAHNTWKPGEAMPSELELALKYKVSTGTVRKAIDLLAAQGLVERRSGSGNFVRRPDFNTSYIRFTRVWGSAGDRRIPQSRIYNREVVTGPSRVTTLLNLEEDAQVIRLSRLRVFEGLPIIREEIWLDNVRFAEVLTMEEQPRLLYPMYEKLCGAVVARARETITIDTVNEADTALLGLDSGTSVVAVERLSLGYDDCPIELRYSRSPAADFHYKVDIW